MRRGRGWLSSGGGHGQPRADFRAEGRGAGLSLEGHVDAGAEAASLQPTGTVSDGWDGAPGAEAAGVGLQ